MNKRSYFPLLLIPILLCTTLITTLLQALPLYANSAKDSGTRKTNVPSTEIIARARSWTAIPVPYNMSTEYQGYRMDCSGLVTMAWGLPPNLPNGGLFTGNQPYNPDQPGSLSSIADLLGKALDNSGNPVLATMTKLQAGDILLNQSRDQHVIIFVGWIDIAAKQVVSHPILNKDGRYYYDGIEENGDVGAIEHTPDRPINTSSFDYRQPWPYPYYPGYDSEGYYAWRFDATKAANLGYTGSGTSNMPTIKPSGEWMAPSPINGDLVTQNILHLAAAAYPTKQNDPVIQTVNFTLEINGNWTVACSLDTPSSSGGVYSCDVDLSKFNFPLGQLQALQLSFDVIDMSGNVNLAPQGIRNISYVPTGNMTGFDQFVGLWKEYGTVLNIANDGKASYEGRTYVFCDTDPRPPCDGGDQGLAGLNTTILFFNVNGTTAYGTIIGGTGDRVPTQNTIIPVGGSISITLTAKDQLQASDTRTFTLCADDPNAMSCISNT